MQRFSRRLLLLSLLALPAVVSGETIEFRDSHNMPDGRAVVQGNRTEYFDKQGMPVGRSERRGNAVQYYDRDGMPTRRDIIKR